MNFYEAWRAMREGKRCATLDNPMYVFFLVKLDKQEPMHDGIEVFFSSRKGFKMHAQPRNVMDSRPVRVDEAAIDCFMGSEWEIVE